MAIKRDVKVVIANELSKIDDSIYVYQHDRGIDLYFDIQEHKFSFTGTQASSLVRKTEAMYAGITVKKPDGTGFFRPVLPILDEKVLFRIEHEHTNDFEEIGIYKLQIHLYDKFNNRVSIPAFELEVKPLVVDGVRESFDEEVSTDAIIDYAVVDVSTVVDDNALFTIEKVGDASYVKTVWKSGDVITVSKMNNIEDGIERLANTINQIEIPSIDGLATEEYVDEAIRTISLTPGADGADGKSAYEIAVEEGFVGSVEDWLASLKGTNGIDGAPGRDGTNGIDGKSVELQKTDTHVQWRQTDGQWQDLIALEELKGDKGDTGEAGSESAYLGEEFFTILATNKTIPITRAELEELRPTLEHKAVVAQTETGVFAGFTKPSASDSTIYYSSSLSKHIIQLNGNDTIFFTLNDTAWEETTLDDNRIKSSDSLDSNIFVSEIMLKGISRANFAPRYPHTEKVTTPNDIIKNGIYYVDMTTSNGLPAGIRSGVLRVTSTGNIVYQALHTTSTVYQRFYNSSWSAWKVVGSGSGGSSVDLSNFYTKAETDEKIREALADVNVDLAGYATEEHVAQEIAKLDIPNLEGYATEEHVTQKINEVLNGYCTKEELKAKFELSGIVGESSIPGCFASAPEPADDVIFEMWVKNDVGDCLVIQSNNLSGARVEMYIGPTSAYVSHKQADGVIYKWSGSEWNIVDSGYSTVRVEVINKNEVETLENAKKNHIFYNSLPIYKSSSNTVYIEASNKPDETVYDDYNTVINEGYYKISHRKEISNCPAIIENGHLDVKSVKDEKLGITTIYQEAKCETGNVYTRTKKANNEWTEWKEVGDKLHVGKISGGTAPTFDELPIDTFTGYPENPDASTYLWEMKCTHYNHHMIFYFDTDPTGKFGIVEKADGKLGFKLLDSSFTYKTYKGYYRSETSSTGTWTSFGNNNHFTATDSRNLTAMYYHNFNIVNGNNPNEVFRVGHGCSVGDIISDFNKATEYKEYAVNVKSEETILNAPIKPPFNGILKVSKVGSLIHQTLETTANKTYKRMFNKAWSEWKTLGDTDTPKIGTLTADTTTVTENVEADFNRAYKCSMYNVRQVNNVIPNSPMTGAMYGVLKVSNVKALVHQTLETTEGRTFKRMLNGNWTAWKEVGSGGSCDISFSNISQGELMGTDLSIKPVLDIDIEATKSLAENQEGVKYIVNHGNSRYNFRCDSRTGAGLTVANDYLQSDGNPWAITRYCPSRKGAIIFKFEANPVENLGTKYGAIFRMSSDGLSFYADKPNTKFTLKFYSGAYIHFTISEVVGKRILINYDIDNCICDVYTDGVKIKSMSDVSFSSSAQPVFNPSLYIDNTRLALGDDRKLMTSASNHGVVHKLYEFKVFDTFLSTEKLVKEAYDYAR